MKFADISKTVDRFIINNSPILLTAVGVVGTATTAYLTYKGTTKANSLIFEEIASKALAQEEYDPSNKEIFLKTWKFYMPAVGVGTLTCAAIIFANRIETKRTAAALAAFAISERARDEYKEKVVEKFGAGKEKKIREEIAQDQVIKTPTVIVAGEGQILCYESFFGSMFTSDMEMLRTANNTINSLLMLEGYVGLDELFTLMGIKGGTYAGEVGWSWEPGERLIELDYTAVLTEDGRPCMSIDYSPLPRPGFTRFR